MFLNFLFRKKKKFIINGPYIDSSKFYTLKKIGTPFKAAKLANDYFNKFFNIRRLEIDYIKDMPHDICLKKYDLVFYPGSGDDLSVIFALPNAEIYILQDPLDLFKYLKRYMEVLNRIKMIQNLKISKNKFTFKFNDENKELIAYFGKRKGNSLKFIPREIKKHKIDFIYTKAFTLNSELLVIVRNKFLNHLKKHGYIHSCLVPTDEFYQETNFKRIDDFWWQKVN